ncbi:hypothetical protein BDV98DRAFT_561893 [Pterulicium gracile]|uniref:Uncharacterized protein n=1 Tax=Pterulicium gracile TaxID=1884261 RepID=A0A5C3QVD5_9AGAR|nr:hypothetical protein BDV98DRAFT_561893 [Pterula gracilis]
MSLLLLMTKEPKHWVCGSSWMLFTASNSAKLRIRVFYLVTFMDSADASCPLRELRIKNQHVPGSVGRVPGGVGVLKFFRVPDSCGLGLRTQDRWMQAFAWSFLLDFCRRKRGQEQAQPCSSNAGWLR